MWICEGEDVTSNSEFQQPTLSQTLGQGRAHPTGTGYVGWGGYGTADDMEEVKSKVADTANW